MGAAKLVVLGSINADHILNIGQFPQPGETVRGITIRLLLVVKVRIRRLLLDEVVLT